jgi:hypothetical protein
MVGLLGEFYVEQVGKAGSLTSRLPVTRNRREADWSNFPKANFSGSESFSEYRSMDPIATSASFLCCISNTFMLQ